MVLDGLEVGEPGVVVDINLLFVGLVVVVVALQKVFDVDLGLNLVEEALEERQVDVALAIQLASVGAVGDAGPDDSLEEGIGVDSSQVVVDALHDVLLLFA